MCIRDSFTFAVQHWRVYVAGHGTYQAGGDPNTASFLDGDPANLVGRFRAGETGKTIVEMHAWVD
eukprot:5310533-Pyramimonas_sp.AAC.1